MYFYLRSVNLVWLCKCISIESSIRIDNLYKLHLFSLRDFTRVESRSVSGYESTKKYFTRIFNQSFYFINSNRLIVHIEFGERRKHTRGMIYEYFFPSGDRISAIRINFSHMVYEDAKAILSTASPYEVEIEVEDGSMTANTGAKSSSPNSTHSFYRSQSFSTAQQVNMGNFSRFLTFCNEIVVWVWKIEFELGNLKIENLFSLISTSILKKFEVWVEKIIKNAIWVGKASNLNFINANFDF